ncbi:thioredoxin domain-containing protein [Sphingomonas sp. CGMCC 1.13654]|uniref:Thioredoxin domain-containing protein n=1 Tax=Sphingomonas chungangi TaxID=2683589 RepID=A0A838L328_9SPHN|nr:thioredoxin domain-containing protein [Sphingomonas chungangi]MBA2932819.1 thioredoxin domain-containing protein [Sphingomonas chungangi]MVW56441.1 thioredoxin domain-containing protein [Sphingomonas chungangi]
MIRTLLALLALASPVAAQAATRHPPVHGAQHVADWTKTIALTPDGGMRIGNPAAKVKVLEFFSFTCPHCAAFATEGATPLIQNYVRGGQVSYELRPALRDAIDLTMALAARSVATPRYFDAVGAVMGAQQDWLPKAYDYISANRDKLNSTDNTPAIHAMLTSIGIEAMLAKQGVTSAALERGLADKTAEAALQKTTNDAWNVRHISGTPGFFINDAAQPDIHGWAQLEPAVQAAIKG